MVVVSRYTLIKWDIKISRAGFIFLWILMGSNIIYNAFFMLYYMGAEEQSRIRLNAVKSTPEYAYAVSPDYLKEKPKTSIPKNSIFNPNSAKLKIAMEIHADSLKALIDSRNEEMRQNTGAAKSRKSKHEVIKLSKAKQEEHIVVPDPPVKILIPEKYNGPAKDSLYKPAIKIIPHGRTISTPDRP